MKHILFIGLILLGVRCGALAVDEALAWTDHSILETNTTIPALNALANTTNIDRAERARATFALFANYIKPGQAGKEVHAVLTDTTWLRQAHVHRLLVTTGPAILGAGGKGTEFSLDLFADEDGVSDWRIHFRLSGSWEWREEDASAFLSGKSLDGNPEMVEFVLCFPPSRVERFGKSGIHVYHEYERGW